MVNTHKLRQINPNVRKFQFTFYSENYKPVACIIETEKGFVDIVKDEQTFKKMAIVKICQKRGWTHKDFKNYNYNTFKFRRITD